MNSFPFKRLLITLAVLLALLLALFVIAPMFVDAKKAEDVARAQVEALTGQALVVQGAASVSFFPVPSITFPEVSLQATTPEAPRLQAAGMEIELSWGSVFSDTPAISSLKLIAPRLTLAKGTDGLPAFGWLSLPPPTAPLPFALFIDQGEIIVTNADPTEAPQRVQKINLSLLPDSAGYSATGSLDVLGQTLELSGRMPLITANSAPAELRLWQGEQVGLSLMVAPTRREDGTLVWQGTLNLGVDDIKRFGMTFTPGTVPPTPEQAAAPYKIHAQGKVLIDSASVMLTELSVETSDSAGSGNITFTKQETVTADVALQFTRLKLHAAPFRQWFTPKQTGEKADVPMVVLTDATAKTPRATLRFDVSAKEVLLDDAVFQNGVFKGSIDDLGAHIAQLSATMGESGTLQFSGDVVETARGQRFQGNMQTQGPDMRQLLALFDGAALRLPAASFANYSLTGNVFASAEQFRLSEAELKVAELELRGGMVAYFEATPRLEAEVLLRNTNLDYFRNVWRDAKTQNLEVAFAFAINNKVDFNWLKQFRQIIDFKFNFDGFTFFENTGTAGSLRLYARAGEVGIRGIDLNYPQGKMAGDLLLRVNDETPVFDVNLSSPFFNTAYFSANGAAFGEPLLLSDKQGEERWSGSIFDFSWMAGVNGKANLNITNFTHQDENYAQFSVQSELKDQNITVSKLSFEKFGGRVDATAAISGGKVPGLRTSFTLYNMDMRAMLLSLFNVKSLSGHASISGVASTSGINFREWVRQADAKLVVAARGVRADGFNLQGIVDGVNAARSVAEVATNIEKTMPIGSTDFSLDGNLNLQQGALRTPGLTLQAGESLAAIKGEVQVMAWRMALNALFQMRMFPSETVPTLSIDMTGSPDAPEVKLDTTSLEAYVAKRIVGR